MPRKQKTSCGDFGGKGVSGNKCRRRAGQGTNHRGKGCCHSHDDEADETMKALKKRALELVEAGDKNLVEIAQEIDKAPVTLWRWRNEDLGFDAAIKSALVQADLVRTQEVEDSLYERLKKGTGTGLELIFYLCNRAPHRWKSVQRVEYTGRDGGPIEHRYDLTKLNDNELKTLETLQRRAAVLN